MINTKNMNFLSGKCDLTDDPSAEKVVLKIGHNTLIELTYESAIDLLAVLSRWLDIQRWNEGVDKVNNGSKV